MASSFITILAKTAKKVMLLDDLHYINNDFDVSHLNGTDSYFVFRKKSR